MTLTKRHLEELSYFITLLNSLHVILTINNQGQNQCFQTSPLTPQLLWLINSHMLSHYVANRLWLALINYSNSHKDITISGIWEKVLLAATHGNYF